MTDELKDTEIPVEAPLHGVLAEYPSPSALIAAARKIRDAGYTRWDTFTPFPVHGIEKAMGIRMTVLPWIVLGAGLTGCATGVALQWWTNAVNYPWIVSGKPFFSLPANVPVIFELSVLFAATAALVGMLVLNGLPHPSHPLDLKSRFGRSTVDRFFLYVQADDPKFDDDETQSLLTSTETSGVELVVDARSTPDKLPTGWIYAVIILVVAALVPFGLIARARETRTANPRIHAIGDMDWQPKFKAQRANLMFPDGRAMRKPPAGTVAQGELRDDEHFYRGKIGGVFARTFPEQIQVAPEVMQRGQERFGIYCAPCHGFSGAGDGMVTKRAQERGQPWVPPTNLHQENIRLQPVGQLFDSITNGVRNMPPYGHQIESGDRWAIILYMRALQRSRRTGVVDVPETERTLLK
jgi:mono/diheme cytochrome c family protein